jgi:membrane protein required for colicin V production
MVSGIDIILMIALVAFTVSGFSKGLISKVLSLGALLGGIIFSAKFGKQFAAFIARSVGMGDMSSGLIAIVIIFVGLFIVANILSRAFKKIAVMQVWDRLGGAVFGFLEGTLILSLLLLLLAIFDIPSNVDTINKSFSYKPIKNFAPMLYHSFLSKSTEEFLDRFFSPTHSDK